MEIALAGLEPLRFDLKAIDGLTPDAVQTWPSSEETAESVDVPTFENSTEIAEDPTIPTGEDPGTFGPAPTDPAPAAPAPAAPDPAAGATFPAG
jgi:hypothetical protein